MKDLRNITDQFDETLLRSAFHVYPNHKVSVLEDEGGGIYIEVDMGSRGWMGHYVCIEAFNQRLGL